jgi:hypothetical protein
MDARLGIHSEPVAASPDPLDDGEAPSFTTVTIGLAVGSPERLDRERRRIADLAAGARRCAARRRREQNQPACRERSRQGERSCAWAHQSSAITWVTCSPSRRVKPRLS